MSEARLAKVVKQRTVVSTGAGMAMATVSYSASMELATIVLGDSAWIAILVAGLFCLMAGSCFAELSGMYPTAAGIKLFIERAFNERVAMLFATLYITVAISVVGAETFVLAHVLHDGTGITAVPPWAWGVTFLLVVLGLNLRGIRIAGTAQDVLAYSMFAFLIGSSLYAIAISPQPLHTPLSVGGPGRLLEAVAVGVFLYVGFEWVTPLAEEVTDQRLIARGLFLTVGVLFVTYASFNAALTMTMAPAIQARPADPTYASLIDAAIAKGALPATVDRAHLTYDQAKQAFGTSVVPHVLLYRHLFGTAGLAVIVAMSLLASVTSFNAGTITASRFLYALARDGSMPKVFSRISIRYATPYMALIALSGLCLAISATVFVTERYVPESYETFIYLGAFVECMIYTVMACSLIALRRRQPQADRPYRVPGGYLIPAVVAVFFGCLMIAIVIAHPVVGVVVAGLAMLTAYYGWKVVPAMRARARAARARRPRRRPVRASAE
ncbi:MAG: APC family permease [Candidatus Dadabacteria bacterium]|nr:MAG: APC family permease [Candidatus Dadabacteria bacterium]